MKQKISISIAIFVSTIVLFLISPTEVKAGFITNICGLPVNEAGVIGTSPIPGCSGNCWSNDGRNGYCRDPGGGANQVVIVHTCAEERGNRIRCDSRDGGIHVATIDNDGATISTADWLGDNCKVQLDILDYSLGNPLVDFVVLWEPNNCGECEVGAPTNLDFDCIFPGNRVTVFWNSDPDADYYSLRVDKDPPSWNGNCSSPNPGDFCVEEIRGNSYSFDVDPTARYSWWIHSRADCDSGVWGARVDGPMIRCSPNCSNLTGPTSVSVGDSATYISDFESLDGSLRGEIYSDNFASSIEGPENLPGYPNATSGNLSGVWNTTDSDVGCHTIYCRAWNNAISECQPPDSHSPPIYNCVGPDYSLDMCVNYCEFELTPVSLTGIGDTGEGMVEIDPVTGEQGDPTNHIETVQFGIDDLSVAEFIGSNIDNSASFTVRVGALRVNDSTDYTGLATMGDGTTCTSTGTISVGGGIGAWWQAKDGDVQTNANIASDISSSCDPETTSCEPYLIAGSPAVPIAAGGISWGSYSDAGSSKLDWVAEDSKYMGDWYDHNFFENQLPSADILSDSLIENGTFDSCSEDGNYCYYSYDGSSNLEINAVGGLDLGERKIVILVTGVDVNIESDIDLEDGLGFLLIVTDGNINIGSGVSTVKGILVADNDVNTCSGCSGNDDPLTVHGSVIAWRKVNLQRSLLNNTTTSAETFEFAPEQILLFPPVLGKRNIRWTEVAP
jgi:hypothetical protein